MILQNLINHKLNMNYGGGYLNKWEKESECMPCCTKLILIMHVHCFSFVKTNLDSCLIAARSLALTEMCQ